MYKYICIYIYNYKYMNIDKCPKIYLNIYIYNYKYMNISQQLNIHIYI